MRLQKGSPAPAHQAGLYGYKRKVAAYFAPWKHKIERLERGDVVFLYKSGAGIVAMGEDDGKLEKAAYHYNPDHPDEGYFRKLRNFQLVDPPLTAAEIKSLSGVNYVFRNTMFGIDSETGMRIRRVILDRPLAAKKPLARRK